MKSPGYDAYGYGASNLEDFMRDVYAPAAYGGVFVLENSAGAGALVASAPSIAKLIAHYPVYNDTVDHLSGYEPNTTRYGELPGTHSIACTRDDRITWSVILNRRLDPRNEGAPIDALRDLLNQIIASHAAEF